MTDMFKKIILILCIGLLPHGLTGQPVPEVVFGTDLTNGYPILGITEYNDMLIGTGLFFPAIFSLDNGVSWSQNPPLLPQASDFVNNAPSNINFTARHLAAEGDLVMMTSSFRYIQLSRDRGETWELVNTGFANNLTFESAKIMNGNLYIEQNSNPGYRVSRDTGATWQSIQPVANTRSMSIVTYRDTLFTSILGNVTNPRIHFSTDNGFTWTAASTGVTNAQGNGSKIHIVGDDLVLITLAGLTFRWENGAWQSFTLPGSGGRTIYNFGGSLWLAEGVNTNLWKFNPVEAGWEETQPLLNGNPTPPNDLFQATFYAGDDFRLISYTNTFSINDPTRRTRLFRVDVNDDSFALRYAPGLNSAPTAHLVSEKGMYLFQRAQERFYMDQDGFWKRGLPALTNNNETLLDMAEIEEGIIATSSTGRILLFGHDFSGPEVKLTSISNARISSNGEKIFLVSGNTMRISSDGGETFELVNGLPANARLAKVTFSEAGILSGNMFSTDGGETWTQQFSLPSNRPVSASVRHGDVYLIASTVGLFVKAGNENPVLVNNGGISGSSNIEHLVTTGRTAVFSVGRVIYYTTNNGQTIEQLTTLMPTTNIIRSMSIVDNDLYVAQDAGLQRWDLSTLGASFFVQTLDPVQVVAADSSRNGVRATFKGIVNSPAQEVSIFFEYRNMGAATILGTTQAINVQPSEEQQEIEIIFTGLPQNALIESRIVGISGDTRINGSWLYKLTPVYQYWRDISPESCETCAFYDAVSLSDGRYILTSNAGVFISDDKAVSWQLAEGSTAFITSLIVTQNDTLIGGTLSGGFTRSSDRGETWEPIQIQGLPSLGGNQRIVRMAYSAAFHTIIAIYGERQPATNNAVRVIFSENGARNWSVITDTLNLQNRLPFAMTSDPEGNLYIGTNSQDFEDPIIRRSVDGGYTWEALLIRDSQFTPTVSEAEHIEIFEGKIIFRSQHGFWTSTDNGETFGSFRQGAGRLFVTLSENEFITVNGRKGSDSFFFNDALFIFRPEGTVVDIKSGYPTNHAINRLIKLDEDVILVLGQRGLYRWRMGGDGDWVSIPRQETANLRETPSGTQLGQNYPNPFNPVTHIPFTLTENAMVSLEIFNVLGQRVAVLINNEMTTAGRHQVRFEADRLTSGVYIYRLKTGTTYQTGKMMLIK